MIKDYSDMKRISSRLRKRSGEISSKDPLVAFLYDLMRDHLTVGKVEKLVSEAEVSSNADYTNGWLAKYAKDVAKRLRK